MNFYHDINSGTFLNIRSHRVDGSSPNHTYIVRIYMYVNPHNIILKMYAYLCASSLNYTYIVRILVCILTKSYLYCAFTRVHPHQIIFLLYVHVCVSLPNHTYLVHIPVYNTFRRSNLRMPKYYQLMSSGIIQRTLNNYNGQIKQITLKL